MCGATENAAYECGIPCRLVTKAGKGNLAINLPWFSATESVAYYH